MNQVLTDSCKRGTAGFQKGEAKLVSQIDQKANETSSLQLFQMETGLLIHKKEFSLRSISAYF